MAGVRLHHATLTNVRFNVVEPRPYIPPFQCSPPEFGGCGLTHEFKTHHLNVDDTGSVIIGDVLYETIRAELEANGFSVESDVAKPPTLGIGLGQQVAGLGQWGNIPIIEGVTGG
jgi:hypothetical protein